ncbi:Diphthine--ammonia ligase [Sphaceloma murrayae]|uniref:Diphthine--ammonia ligase n=1 Tax=Sphaceloma murrayae TaxID=2082308 RepID=A0A2K1QG11_9PEZI|nr:Diphthine--ammonia ligase [Sphaceloma murrayae]
MPPLQVVALISGGKDSLFSILHCLANGHRVVALGNLHPHVTTIDDLDSFMYQTVGHNMIHLIAQALELPLYRQSIVGSAVSTSKTYDTQHASHSTDEVESMHVLLARVKQNHPQINAVSTGAILSDYQRTRVESVALRLGLTPLSYLWQYLFLPPYDERQLLLDMAEMGQDSRIVKVTSGSLDQAFLWSNVADQRTIVRLSKAAQRFSELGDGSIVGEGGEYETLTIDGPSPLWKHKIQVEEVDRNIIHDKGGTALLNVLQAKLVRKDWQSAPTAVRIPALFDDIFAVMRGPVLAKVQAAPPSELNEVCNASPLLSLKNVDSSTGPLSQLANLTAPGASAADQIRQILHDLEHIHKIPSARMIHTTILLRSMSDFPSMNAIYTTYFPHPNPPSRITISAGSLLPPNTHISLSVLHSALPRTSLHVQSQSYWAPANIGPYSQATSISTPASSVSEPVPPGTLTTIAGQIPLHPATMDLHLPTLPPLEQALDQSLLAAQHLLRVAQITRVNLFLGAVVCIGRDAVADAMPYVRAAGEIWRGMHVKRTEDEEESDEEVDVWDVKNRVERGDGWLVGRSQGGSTYRDTLQRDCTPPLFVVEVQGLPRGASVEWCGVGWGGNGRCRVERKGVWEEVGMGNGRGELSGWMGLGVGAGTLEEIDVPAGVMVTLYTTGEVADAVLERLKPTVVPCFRIWDAEGKMLRAVVAYMKCPL